MSYTLSWKTHIDTIIPKLSSTTFAIRTVKPYLSQDSLKMIYYSYFHSIMTYGIILGGNSRYRNTIFRLQKKIITIIMGLRNRDSCREHFKKLKILPLQSQYIYYHFYFSLLAIGVILKKIWIYTTLILELKQTYISH